MIKGGSTIQDTNSAILFAMVDVSETTTDLSKSLLVKSPASKQIAFQFVNSH